MGGRHALFSRLPSALGWGLGCVWARLEDIGWSAWLYPTSFSFDALDSYVNDSEHATTRRFREGYAAVLSLGTRVKEWNETFIEGVFCILGQRCRNIWEQGLKLPALEAVL